jgi:SWIB/MDM2 domain-containing protein
MRLEFKIKLSIKFMSEKQVKPKRVSKVKKVPQAEPEPEPEPEVVVPSDPSVDSVSDTLVENGDQGDNVNHDETEKVVEVHVEDKIKDLIKSLDTNTVKQTKQTLKVILSDYLKELKENKIRKRKSSGNYVARGCTKPVMIDSELSTFLGVNKGELISRPTVTKLISQYLKKNDLEMSENRSIFNVDKALGKILGKPVHPINKTKPELGLGYSYKNLQTYLKPRFISS